MVRAGKAAFGGTEGKARAFLPNVIDAVEHRHELFEGKESVYGEEDVGRIGRIPFVDLPVTDGADDIRTVVRIALVYFAVPDGHKDVGRIAARSPVDFAVPYIVQDIGRI